MRWWCSSLCWVNFSVLSLFLSALCCTRNIHDICVGPFALWLGGDPERNRSFHWKPNSYYYYYDDPLNQTDENKVYDSGFWGDFWLHFGSNLGNVRVFSKVQNFSKNYLKLKLFCSLGHGAFFALAVILLVASIYGV